MQVQKTPCRGGQLPATGRRGGWATPWRPCLTALAATALLVAGTGVVQAHEGYGSGHGHLEGSSRDVQLLSSLRLTRVADGIGDVATHGDYAYLSTTANECARTGGAGTGIHVVRIADPERPMHLPDAFLRSEPNSYAADGLHVLRFGDRDILLHSNLNCSTTVPVTGGFSIWDVTRPESPTSLGQFGDASPAARTKNTFHMTHSVQGFTWKNRLYAVAADDWFEQDAKDVDIFDITPALTGGVPVLVAETGAADWPAAFDGLGAGDRLYHHDMQQRVIAGHNRLLLSYWDAGQVLLDIDDPARPVYLADSDYPARDPETGVSRPEGESHSSQWSSDGRFVVSTDEDFTPRRPSLTLTTPDGPVRHPAREFQYTAPVPAGGFTGRPVFGGTGCPGDADGNGLGDQFEVGPAPPGEDAIVVFTNRVSGTCPVSEKITTAYYLGYDVVVLAGVHADTAGGLTPDSYGFCPNVGGGITSLPAICIGHRTLHRMFDAAEDMGYQHSASGKDDDLPPVRTLGARITVGAGTFDGWGYAHLLDAQTLAELDTFAIPEALQPERAAGSGTLSAHDVKTDPRRNRDLAYVTWFAGGLRVLAFGSGGITEAGHFIDPGGSDYWGVSPVCSTACLQQTGNPHARPYLAVSDRDVGLKILRYTGRE